MIFLDEDDGIFWKGDEVGPWRKLGVNLLGAFVIAVWSVVWLVEMEKNLIFQCQSVCL